MVSSLKMLYAFLTPLCVCPTYPHSVTLTVPCKENKLDSVCNFCYIAVTVIFVHSLPSPQCLWWNLLFSWTQHIACLYCVACGTSQCGVGQHCRLYFVLFRQSPEQLGPRSHSSVPCHAVSKQGTRSGIQCYSVRWHYSCQWTLWPMNSDVN